MNCEFKTCVTNICTIRVRMTVLLHISVLIFILEVPQQGKCLNVQAIFRNQEGKYLANHVIKTKHAKTELECSWHCVGQELCVSVNYKTSGIGKGRCELNNKTFQDKSDNGESLSNHEFKHIAIVKKVRENINIQKRILLCWGRSIVISVHL